MTALLFISLLAFFIQQPYLNEFPSFIHAWTQSDNYALALGFLDNGLDLFHPQMMLYNKGSLIADNTITAVDFPLHQWLAALWMFLLGVTEPWVFRLWTTLIAIGGTYCTYRAACLATRSKPMAMMCAVIFLSAPSLAYYFSGFIPTVPALSCMAAALWAFLSYTESHRPRWFIVSLALATLSTLMRASFAVALAALLVFEALRILHRDVRLSAFHACVILAVLCIVAYRIWYHHLATTYGSAFLNRLMPARSLDEVSYILHDMKQRWLYHYFSRFHYLVMTVCTLLAIGYAIVHRLRHQHVAREYSLSLWYLVAIWLMGECCFFVAMMRQYCDHDYYFLDTFFLPILFAFMLVLRTLPVAPPRWGGVVATAVVLLFSAWSVRDARIMQQQRRTEGTATVTTIEHYRQASQLLDSLSIPSDATILCLLSYPPQTPFILMHRKGISVINSHHDEIVRAYRAPFDYVVIENQNFLKYYDTLLDDLARLRPIGSNGHITVCTLSDTAAIHSL